MGSGVFCFDGCGVFAVQDRLRSADLLVQLLVIRGDRILGRDTQNVSACLQTEIRRGGMIVDRLGALVCGLSVSCCCEDTLGRSRSGPASPSSSRGVELACLCSF